MERIRHAKQSALDGILFLQGVFKKDCRKLEDMLQDKLMNVSASPPQDIKTYDKIPVSFTTVDKWIKSTNLTCWFCHRTFKNRPWFEPQSIEPVSEGEIGNILGPDEVKNSVNTKSHCIIIHGIFCTCNCVRAYINLHTKDLTEKLNKVAMLKYVYELFNGKSIPDIQPSPPPTDMVQYGGTLTTTAYQQKIDSLDAAYIEELEDNNFSAICIYMKTMGITG